MTDLDALAETMLPPATALVVAVHDHDVAAAHATLAGLDVLQLRALAVTLAALVPDDHTLTELLAWTRSQGPISDRQAAVNRQRLEATLAAHDAHRRGRAA
ncbi:hypothetical protein [Microbispora rosea]|uniref:hypothetical protein n=1 Tax=Microbispora rosea TaxID=58117 RepID=UPI003798C255